MGSPLPSTSPAALGLAIPDEINIERLRELEHLAEIGRLSASLLHDISSPLTTTLLWLEQYNNRQSPHIRHARRTIRLLQRYVDAARQQVRREGQPQHFCLQPELEQVRRILGPLARRRGVRLQFASAAGCKLHGDPVKFQQIIANLVQNAIDAYASSPATANKLVRLSITQSANYITIEVRDSGCGIAGQQLSQLFEPFYSTKQSTGLGLFTVKRCIENDFRGSIRVRSSRQQGTCFSVRLNRQPNDADKPRSHNVGGNN